MQFCVYITALQYGYVHIEAESEDEAKSETEKLFNQHRISWHDEEITDMIAEKVYEQEGGAAMRILVVEPERRPEVREIDGSLKSMQEIVGGLIQPIYLDDSVALICNDEGKLMKLPANRGLRDRNGQIYDVVFGTFFLCGAPADSDHFTSLTPEQIERYRKQFYIPEMFWGVDGQIVCVPCEGSNFDES